ncbi:CPBP family intramembrane glutamic endopeptidase [Corynebacterium sp. H128]|uniref:CPBP family intramembrane glutamic endopeptidase n=1 Tax=Corynebacterium sp. H128 TaxID=3133427 RepID=UPI0030A60370
MTTNSFPKPLIPLTWWGIAIRSAIAVGMLLGANLLAGALLEAVVPMETLSNNQQLWAVLGLFLGVFLLVLGAVALWMKTIERRPLSATGMTVHSKWLTGLLLSTALSVVIVVTTRLITTGLFPEAPREAIDASQFGELSWFTFTIFILGRAFFLQGIPEELLFRGWLFQLLPQRPKITLAFTTAVFTIIHLTSNGGQQSVLDRFLYLMIPLGFGLLAGVLVLATGNFWHAVGIHGGFHIGTVLAAVVLPETMVSVDWVIIGAGYIAVAAGIGWFDSRRRQASAISSQARQGV